MECGGPPLSISIVRLTNPPATCPAHKENFFPFQTFPDLSQALCSKNLRAFAKAFAGLSFAFVKGAVTVESECGGVSNTGSNGVASLLLRRFCAGAMRPGLAVDIPHFRTVARMRGIDQGNFPGGIFLRRRGIQSARSFRTGTTAALHIKLRHFIYAAAQSIGWPLPLGVPSWRPEAVEAGRRIRPVGIAEVGPAVGEGVNAHGDGVGGDGCPMGDADWCRLRPRRWHSWPRRI